MQKGFESEGRDSQKVFRQLLSALSNPGKIVDMDIDLLPPDGIHPAAAAVLLTLLDFDTPLWSDLDNDTKEMQWIRFHTGAPYVYSRNRAVFALHADYDTLDNLDRFNTGTAAAPHQSTTLIVQTRGMDGSGRIRLSGPGVKSETFLKLKGVKEPFLLERIRLQKAYPLGIDLFFTWNRSLVSVPRSTAVEIL